MTNQPREKMDYSAADRTAVPADATNAEAAWDDFEDVYAENGCSEFGDEADLLDAWQAEFAADTPDPPHPSSDDFDPEASGDYGSQIELMLSAIGNAETKSGQSSPPADQEDDGTVFTDNATASRESDIFADDAPHGQIDHKTVDATARKQLQADRELLDAYLDDAVKCVESMERCVLALEESADHAEPVRQFCRELHTLKGASATVGLSGLASFLHNLETSLESLFQDDQCHADADQLLTCVDTVRESIQSLDASDSSPQRANKKSPDSAGSNSLATPHRKPLDFSSHGGSDDASIRIRASRLDRLMDMLAELVVLRNRRESDVAEFNRLNDELTRCATRLRLVEGFADLDATDPVQHDTNTGSQTLEGITQEISRDIAELSAELRAVQKPISTDNLAISRFVRDFRQELMQLRRMPVSGLFQRLQRAARDAAKVESKQVQVQLMGAETGLEQELQEQLYEPLMHIVRNAVGHGIEPPEQRSVRGKPSAGTITLEAKSSAQLLVIEIRDDGNGLDYDAVRKRARDKGLIPAHANPSEAELARLIFHPGFSTRTEVNELAGRGVGMDVVATAIEQLHGRIEIHSQPGTGTTMRLSIPLRSGIEHVLVFRSAGQLFALPMQSVHASRKLDPAKGDRTNELHSSFAAVSGLTADETVNRESQLITLRALEQSLNQNSEPSIGNLKSRRSIRVEEIVGPEEVVIRSLPAFLARHPLFCGITLSGTGETVLLIDSDRLATHCDQFELQDTATCESSDSPSHFESSQPTALVVDDSLSARKHLVRKLQACGYATTEANDGVAALEILRDSSFDVIFTDLDMPQLGGLELLAELQTGRHRETPAVVVSSRAESRFRERAAEAGAIDYLVKPATDEQLQSVIKNLEGQYS